MGTTFTLDEQEAREAFRIFRNIVDDAHYRHHPLKDWPLYDKLADYLGEPTLAQHNETLRLRDEEEAVDEWLSACRSDPETSEE